MNPRKRLCNKESALSRGLIRVQPSQYNRHFTSVYYSTDFNRLYFLEWFQAHSKMKLKCSEFPPTPSLYPQLPHQLPHHWPPAPQVALLQSASLHGHVTIHPSLVLHVLQVLTHVLFTVVVSHGVGATSIHPSLPHDSWNSSSFH